MLLDQMAAVDTRAQGNAGWQDLLLPQQVLPTGAAYAQVYVANEDNVPVWFDEVTIVHWPGLQVQETHYDPFGLDLAGLSRSTPGLKALSQYQWNGKEKQADFGLGWTHLDWRFFDPQTGRFHAVDPLTQAGQESWSTYQFGFDNAVRYNDPDGRKVVFAETTSNEDKKAFKREQRELNRRSETARSNWKELKRSNNVHTFHVNEQDRNGKAQTNHVTPVGEINTKEGNSTDVYVSTGKTVIEGVEVPVGIGVGHEEGHAFRFSKGLASPVVTPDLLKLSSTDATNAKFQAIETQRNAEEIAASQIENRIRADYSKSGLPVLSRTVYSNLPMFRMIGENMPLITTYPPLAIPK